MSIGLMAEIFGEMGQRIQGVYHSSNIIWDFGGFIHEMSNRWPPAVLKPVLYLNLLILEGSGGFKVESKFRVGGGLESFMMQ